jgi:hypothetical protein
VSAFELLKGLAVSVIWIGGWAQAIGMPIAWLRLRKTPGWRKRPAGVRRIDLLAGFVLWPTVVSIAIAWLVLFLAALSVGLTGGAVAAIVFGAPLIVVPWAVLQLDPDGLRRLRAYRNQG